MSPDGTKRRASGSCLHTAGSPKVVYMASTSFLVLGSLMMSSAVRAAEAAPSPRAVVTAHATILSAVRVGPDATRYPALRSERNAVQPKPREGPCPETNDRRCRLIVVDMP